MPSNSHENDQKEITRTELRRRTIKSLIGLGLGAVGTGYIVSWLTSREEKNGISYPLRSFLEVNEKVNDLWYNNLKLAPEFPIEKAVPKPRLNGTIGLENVLNMNTWKLQINSQVKDAIYKEEYLLDAIQKLPKTEIVFEFKCIEGWSEISHWGGVRFSEFINYHKKKTEHDLSKASYACFETPDGEYYTAMDMESLLHPQTILCYEMNGKLLTLEHGAPLRLITSVKYGVKSLKRIGSITFTNSRPKDYWAERGYDYDIML